MCDYGDGPVDVALAQDWDSDLEVHSSPALNSSSDHEVDFEDGQDMLLRNLMFALAKSGVRWAKVRL